VSAVKPGSLAFGQATGLSYLGFLIFAIFYDSGFEVDLLASKIRCMNVNLLKQNKWFKRLIWSIGCVLALSGIGWLAVPVIAKSQIEKQASEQLGRKVTLGGVDFKPWSLELTMDNLTIARAEGVADPSPQLFIKRIYIDAALQSLVRLAPVLDAIEVQEPRVNLTYLGEGRYDVDDIVSRLGKASDQPASAPLGFALYNVVLSGGAVDFTDKKIGKTHELRDLQIKLPFLSSLDSQRSVLVQPQLAFRLNGSTFDSNASSTPFAQSHKTDATFKLTDFDVKPYLAYLPASLPVKLSSAVLNADLKLAFEQSATSSVKLTGTLQAGKVKLMSTSSKGKAPELLDFDQLKLTLTDVRPLERAVQLGAVELTGANLSVHRNATGQINLALLGQTPTATKNVAVNASSTGATGQNDLKEMPWKVNVNKVALHGANIHWLDETTAPAARMKLRDVTLNASGLALPFAKPMEFEGSMHLVNGASDEKAGSRASLSFKGSATDREAKVAVKLADVPLATAAPYLAQFITPQLNGSLHAELGVHWKTSADATKPAQLLFDANQLTLDDVALTQDKTSLASVKKFQLSQLQLDLAHQSVSVGKLSVMQPQAAVRRESDGRWMVQSWLKTSSGSSASAAPPTAVAASKATDAKSKPWGVNVQDVSVEGGALKFVDKSTPKAVTFELAAFSLGLKNFSTSNPQPFAANVSTQIRTRRSEMGSVLWQGKAGLNPLVVRGQLDAKKVPVHAFEPYLADSLNIELLRADTSFKGRFSFKQTPTGPVLKVKGDTNIEDFQANSVASTPGVRTVGDELLNWKVLSLRGVDVALAPGVATTVAVQETVLSDFFARLVLSDKGRLNLQDVTKSSDTDGAAVPITVACAPVATKVIAAHAGSTGASEQIDAKPELPAVVSFGPISVLNGRVHFSDHFIQPNYSTNLSELTGKLSAFSSVPPSGVVNLADLELRGRAEGTASLEILGKVNPLAKPLALDIKGKVRDLELSPLSPYSVRYAGYGIERGKLSVDVAYQVQPDGQLTASNNIVLNQLTFGDKVDGAPASLPVKLAVALLADRNGVININLPVNGSLNDPQFKLAPIVFKLILNLIAKAITSPFSLLAHAFDGGGTEEISTVGFAPGSATLTAEAKPGLEKIAKVLMDRPALTMTVVGTASLDAERDAFKREQLNALVLAEKRRVAVVKGAPGSAATSGESMGEVTAADYPVLLKSVYRRADFSKPRNLVGMTKDIPVNEMEALLLAYLPASEEAMQELALQRGVTVRDYLAAQKLPTDRLFLGAPETVSADAKWSPHAELSLSSQ